jgi:integrase
MKFTDLGVQSLKPRASRYDVREGDGFVLRVNTTGKKVWCFVYTLNGEKKRMTLGKYPAMSLSEARDAHGAAKKLADKGIDPAIEQARHKRERQLAPTVADFIDEYIKDYARPKKRTWKADEQMLLKNVKPEIGKIKLKDVTRRDIALVLKKVMARGAQRQANKVLAATRKMFNYAVSQGLIDSSPCLQIAPPGEENSKDRVLSQEEIRTFWTDLPTTNIPPSYVKALRLVLITGMRPSEAGGIEGVEIDGRWLTVSELRMKNKRPHRVYLSDLALETLGIKATEDPDKDKNMGPLLLGPESGKPLEASALGKALKYYLQGLECAPFAPHDLRRTVSTGLSELGIKPHIIDKILSHTDQSVRGKHYDMYSYDREKQHALDIWALHLRGILQDEQQPGAKVIRLFG